MHFQIMPNYRMHLVRFVVAAVIASGTACSNATGTSVNDVATRRAEWQARGIASYTYEFRITGFFIACAAGPVRVHVHGGVVDSATLIATGQPPNAPMSCWPTIDQLFGYAIAAGQNGALADVQFDATIDYPTEIDVSGPPDASGSYFASSLVPDK
jgi:Family of unknown function (DUF6174)